jgi:hypothetical protein
MFSVLTYILEFLLKVTVIIHTNFFGQIEVFRGFEGAIEADNRFNVRIPWYQ